MQLVNASPLSSSQNRHLGRNCCNAKLVSQLCVFKNLSLKSIRARKTSRPCSGAGSQHFPLRPTKQAPELYPTRKLSYALATPQILSKNALSLSCTNSGVPFEQNARPHVAMLSRCSPTDMHTPLLFRIAGHLFSARSPLFFVATPRKS